MNSNSNDADSGASHSDAGLGDARDWPQDFTHENGNYQCGCGVCGMLFYGHKSRVVCRVCASPNVKVSGASHDD